jgi:hypothetical protein
VEFHCKELFPQVGFTVTYLMLSSRALTRFYDKRGTAEQWIKEAKQAAKMTRRLFRAILCRIPVLFSQAG